MYDNHTLTLDWNASASSVSDAESCRRSCLQVLLLDFECVAAVFQKNDSLCKMHLGQTLLGPERLAGLLCQNGHSVAMVRSGFSFSCECKTNCCLTMMMMMVVVVMMTVMMMMMMKIIVDCFKWRPI